MTTDQVKSPLPESLMQAIKATVDSSEMTSGQKFEAVVLITHGYGVFSQNQTINPTAYAIPESQWTAISEMCMTLSDDQFGRVNRALDWMNYGPSGYKE